jgi:hypothetical protein
MKPTYEQLLEIAKVAYRIARQTAHDPAPNAADTHVRWHDIKSLHRAYREAFGTDHHSPDERLRIDSVAVRAYELLEKLDDVPIDLKAEWKEIARKVKEG